MNIIFNCMPANMLSNMIKFKTRAFGCIIVFGWILNPAYGILTEGTTVTASSIFNSATFPEYSNCPNGLIDGKFLYYGASDKCVAHDAATTGH